MKLADAVVEMIEKDIHPSLENKVIVPKLDHDLCVDIIEYAGKNPSTGFGAYKRNLECNRIIQALKKDDRFEQFRDTLRSINVLLSDTTQIDHYMYNNIILICNAVAKELYKYKSTYEDLLVNYIKE